jgi:pimeloyl-ACP methyl ester carboxylesterase
VNTVSSAFGRVAVGAGLLAGVGAAATGISEIRHRRALSHDELWKKLRSPLAGDALEVPSADGTSIHVALFGDESGAPLIVLAPGWTEELHYYDPLIRVLLEFGWRVAAFDLRGQGASGMPVDGDQSLERYGEDVQAVLTAVSAATACGPDEVLVAGHSMGAMSIAAWAASHEVRSRVRAVALINTGLDGLVAASRLLPGVAPSWLLQWLGTDVMLGSAAPHLPVSTAVSRSILGYAAFGPDAPEAVVSFYEPMLWRCPPRVRAAAGRAMAVMNLLPAVARIDVPTLVVAGGHDRLTPVSHSERIAASLPSLFELVVLEDVGHMSPLEAPERLASLLVGLAQVGDDVGRALR